MAYIDSTVAVARRILISPKLAGRQVSLQDSTDSSYGTVVDIFYDIFTSLPGSARMMFCVLIP